VALLPHSFRFANVWQKRGKFAKHWQIGPGARLGFTLLETLVCLGLSALLAVAVLSAVSTFRRAAETEDAAATAERLLNDIASTLRLSPDAELPPLPDGWRAETERFEEPPVAEGYPALGGTRATLFPPKGLLEPVSIAIYDLPRPEKNQDSNPQGDNP
jgi:prepilin-type N-terminal cleavage/methylation domain-containing protein